MAAWGRKERGKAWLLLVLWIFVNQFLVRMGVSMAPGISLVLGFAGAGGVIMASSLLMDVPFSGWLRYVGSHSLVIYVGFYLPMMTAMAAIRRIDLHFSFSTISAMVSILSALAALSLFWMTRNTLLKGLFIRPSWAHIPIPKED